MRDLFPLFLNRIIIHSVNKRVTNWKGKKLGRLSKSFHFLFSLLILCCFSTGVRDYGHDKRYEDGSYSTQRRIMLIKRTPSIRFRRRISTFCPSKWPVVFQRRRQLRWRYFFAFNLLSRRGEKNKCFFFFCYFILWFAVFFLRTQKENWMNSKNKNLGG